MKSHLAIVALLFLAFGQANHKAANIQKPKDYTPKPIDTSNYTILKFDKANNYYFDKNAKPTTLSSEDIVKIEDLINKRVSEYNRVEKDSAISITKRIRKKNHDPNFVWKGDFIKNPSK